MSRELQLRIVEWLDPGAARGDELRATWARLEISIGGHIATRVMDMSLARSVRDAIYAPAYPLAEWIATNWWFLHFECNDSHPGFDRRHTLRFAGDGFAYPPVRILADGIKCHIEAEPRIPAHFGVQFLGRFSVLIDQEQVFEELRTFVSSVCNRLDEQNVNGTLLQEDWKAICSTDPDEASFCRAAAALGCDPYAMSSEEVNAIIAARKMVPEDALWHDLTEAVSLQSLASSERWIDEISNESEKSPKFEPRFSCHDLNGTSNPGALTTWQQGYEGARRLWSSGKLSAEAGTGRLKWDSMFKNWCGLDFDSPATTASPPRTIQALLNSNADRFGITVPANRSSRKESRAFLMARALGDFLWRQPSQVSRMMLTTSQAWRQQRSRAFAAELLAPSLDLKTQLSGSTVNNEELDELADHYGVSDWVIRHQLANHQLATVRV